MKQVLGSKMTTRGIDSGVAGPWVLRPTKRRDVGGENSGADEIEVDFYESPDVGSDVDERLGRSSDGAPRVDVGVVDAREESARRDSPQNLWAEIMHATGEDINQGKLPPIGLFRQISPILTRRNTPRSARGRSR